MAAPKVIWFRSFCLLVFIALLTFLVSSNQSLAQPPAPNNPLRVTNNSDDGTGTLPGTFSYAVSQATGSAGQPVTITFSLSNGVTITFSGPLLPPVQPYVVVDGGECGTTPPIVLNGNGLNSAGLVLQGANTLQNLKIMDFGDRQIVTVGSGSRLACLAAQDISNPQPVNLLAWGFNLRGSLGDGSQTTRQLPVNVIRSVTIPARTKLIQVSAGDNHTLALGDDAKIYAWGSNSNGQLGNGETQDSSTPVVVNRGAIPANVKIVQVKAAAYHSLALGDNGKVYAWGNNSFGQLGDNTDNQSPIPVAVVDGAIPTDVKITQISTYAFHSLALGDDHKVYAWGNNGYGQLGNNTTGVHSFSPVAVVAGAMPPNLKIVQISAGGNYNLVLGDDKNIYAWGDNTVGQLGDDSFGNTSTIPVLTLRGAIPASVTIRQIATGFAHSLAVGDDGKFYAWGLNGLGQLGDGSTSNRYSPVAGTAGAIPVGVKLIQTSGGTQHTLGLGDNGKVYAWGRNDLGQLGDDTTSTRVSPVAVKTNPAISTFRQVECGSLFSFALDGDGLPSSITILTHP